jgi:hypothetical protein
LLSNDWYFFTKLKSTLSIQRFQDIEDVQKNVTAGLKVTWKERFYKCFHHWNHHWTKYLAVEGDSFGGNVQQSATKSFWELKCTNLTSLYIHYFVNSKSWKLKFPDCMASNGITYITNFSEDQSIFQNAETGKFTPTYDQIYLLFLYRKESGLQTVLLKPSPQKPITTHVRGPTTKSRL